MLLKDRRVSSLGCFAFEFWLLRFRFLGAPFSSFGCSVFEFWVLCFRDLGASCDEHLKFTGKTSDQRKCSRSALAEAYVDKRVAGKKGSTKYGYRPTSAGEKSYAPWDGLMDL